MDFLAAYSSSVNLREPAWFASFVDAFLPDFFLWLGPVAARFYQLVPQLPMVWSLCVISCSACGMLWVADLVALLLGFFPRTNPSGVFDGSLS